MPFSARSRIQQELEEMQVGSILGMSRREGMPTARTPHHTERGVLQQ